MTIPTKLEFTKCIIEGHRYNIDTHLQEQEQQQESPEFYYVKCQRCSKRIKIHDKVYYQRREGTYKL